MFLLICLLICSVINYGSDNDSNVGGHSVVRARTPMPMNALSRLPSDDEFCDAIVKSTFISDSMHVRHLRPCLIEVIKQANNSPDDHSPDRRRVMAHLSSGEIQQSLDADNDVNQLLILAVKKALEVQQSEIDDRWAKSTTLIASTVSSAVVGIIVGLVQHFASK